MGRMDALHGLILHNAKIGRFKWKSNTTFAVSESPIDEIYFNGIQITVKNENSQ